MSYRRFSDRSPLQVQTCTVEGGETVCEINSYIRESSQEGVTFSGGLVLGAEVRVVKGITLGGAYSLGMGYTWYEDQQSSTIPQNPQEQTRTNDAISIGTGSPTLNLSVYF